MKKLILFVLVSCFTNISYSQSLPKLQPVKGTQHADKWIGSYAVTKCIICEELNFNDEPQLKNIKEFGLDFIIVPEAELPSCATTNLAAAQYFKIESDSGENTSWLVRHYGMCDWMPVRNYQVLDLSDDYFHYRKQNRNAAGVILSEETFTIDKIATDKFLVHRIIDSAPGSGMPKKVVYLFEADKIANVSPISSSKTVKHNQDITR